MNTTFPRRDRGFAYRIESITAASLPHGPRLHPGVEARAARSLTLIPSPASGRGRRAGCASRIPNKTRRVGGFTLLELLVAVGIFALFSALAYASLDRLIETRDRIDAEREFWRDLTLTFTQLDDDLSQARARTVRDASGNIQPAFLGEPVDPRPLGNPSLELTRAGVFVLGDGPVSDMQHVGYRLRDGTLWRLVWPALDQPPSSQPREYPLIGHVSEMRLRFYSPTGAWTDTWPTDLSATKSLPGAVEITLTFAGRGSYTRVLLVND